MNNLIYIILKNHDSLQFTIPCIKSLLRTSYKNKKILVVDDNSKYIPRKECRELGVELVSLKKYSDFCKSYNIGIKYAMNKKADFVFIVNNDTRNFSKNYFQAVLSVFKHPDVGMVGTKCLNYDRTLQWGKKAHVYFNVSMNVPTCGYILRISMLRLIGGFDNSLFRYYEDLDLLLRLRNAGWKSKFVSSVSFEHYGSGTSNNMTYIKTFYQTRNLFWFIKIHCKEQSYVDKLKHIGNYMLAQFKLLGNSNNKTIILFSLFKGVIVGIFTPWRINHEI